jgi:hypothetical protein
MPRGTMSELIKNDQQYQEWKLNYEQCNICMQDMIYAYQCNNNISPHYVCRNCLFKLVLRRTFYDHFKYTQSMIDNIPFKLPPCAVCLGDNIKYKESLVYNNRIAIVGMECTPQDYQNTIAGNEPYLDEICNAYFHDMKERDIHTKTCKHFNRNLILDILPNVKTIIIKLAKQIKEKQYNEEQYLNIIEDNAIYVKAANALDMIDKTIDPMIVHMVPVDEIAKVTIHALTSMYRL